MIAIFKEEIARFLAVKQNIKALKKTPYDKDCILLCKLSIPNQKQIGPAVSEISLSHVLKTVLRKKRLKFDI